MAKTKISEFSTTAADNTDITNINIAEGCSPANVNNAIRSLMSVLKNFEDGSSGDNVVVGGNLSVTGTTTLVGTAIAPTPSSSDNSTKIATTAFVQAALALLYPIGSIYSSTVSTNPNTLFGFGTWVAYGAGRVLVGVGSGFTAAATGGSADAVVVSHTHTATVTDPGHNHTLTQGGFNPNNGFTFNNGPGFTLSNGSSTTTTVSTGVTVANTAAGVSGTNANLQPYVVVYMWNRTA
jgi:hypothetical protein